MIKRKIEIEKVKKEILPILRNNGVIKAGLFGSFVRGEAKRDSDIDILVKLKGRKSLLDLAGLEIKLEEEFGRRVDLLTYNSLHPLIREKILREEVRII